MVLTTSLVILAATIAIVVVLAEVLRRAASGREIEAEMRRSADLAPIAAVRHRSSNRESIRAA